jgi:hypothetical protein
VHSSCFWRQTYAIIPPYPGKASSATAATDWVSYLDAFDYDYTGKMSPPFFVYYGLNEPPAEGGFGYFAVNPWTGDVWALSGCHKLTTPALRKSQMEIRKRFTREELQQYARLRRLKPECVVED